MEENYNGKYDLYYDPETLEFLEGPCACTPEECSYKEAYVNDGMPTHHKQ